jgi:methylated-DNA-[protein]-cysteine S-methyltransferase
MNGTDPQSIQIETSVGTLRLTATAQHIVRIRWMPWTGARTEPVACAPLLREAARQIRAYADGRLRQFDLPVHADGSSFQQAVWREMVAIPYGEIRTYGDLAEALGAPARAVGSACGSNPVPIVIPCHRVVGRGGKLTGFSGGEGILTKRQLLALEQRHAPAAAGALPLFAG